MKWENLRNPLKLTDVKDIFKNSTFKVFADPAKNEKSRIVALKINQEISRNKIDEYTKFVGNFGAKGLAYIKVNDSNDLDKGLQSPILKFLSTEEISNLSKTLDFSAGDTVFFGADHRNIVNDSMSALREKLGHDLQLIDQEEYKFGWITDFPLFEEDIKGNLSPSHHPFTATNGGIDSLKKDPINAIARAYDLILNGSEIGGGSLRINNLQEQLEIFPQCLDDLTLITKLILGKKIKFTTWEMFRFQKQMIMKNVLREYQLFMIILSKLKNQLYQLEVIIQLQEVSFKVWLKKIQN